MLRAKKKKNKSKKKKKEKNNLQAKSLKTNDVQTTNFINFS